MTKLLDGAIYILSPCPGRRRHPLGGDLSDDTDVTRGLRRMPRMCDYLDVESRAFCARCIVTNSFINRKASRPLRS